VNTKKFREDRSK